MATIKRLTLAPRARGVTKVIAHVLTSDSKSYCVTVPGIADAEVMIANRMEPVTVWSNTKLRYVNAPALARRVVLMLEQRDALTIGHPCVLRAIA